MVGYGHGVVIWIDMDQLLVLGVVGKGPAGGQKTALLRRLGSAKVCGYVPIK